MTTNDKGAAAASTDEPSAPQSPPSPDPLAPVPEAPVEALRNHVVDTQVPAAARLADGDERERQRRSDRVGAFGAALGFVGAVTGIVGLATGIRGCTSAERAVELQQQELDLTQKTLQAQQAIRLHFVQAHEEDVGIRNVSRVSAEKVEFIVRRSIYSPSCDALVADNTWGDHTVPWKQLEGIKPGELVSLPTNEALVRADNFTAFLTGETFACPVPIEGTEHMTQPSPDAGNWRRACSSSAPCVGLLYIEARAMHPKTFEWHGPFKEYFRIEGDGSLTASGLLVTESLVLSSDPATKPKVVFEWNRIEDRQAFAALKREDQEALEWGKRMGLGDSVESDDLRAEPFSNAGLDYVLRKGLLPDAGRNP